MSAAILNVLEVGRELVAGGEETLVFKPGVNLLHGPPNSGKTKWLRTLDYLFGQPDPPEQALGTRVAGAYKRAWAVASIDGTRVHLERRWGPGDSRNRVFIDGEGYSTDDFSDAWLKRLNLPILRFPVGDPHAPRKWPRLSWRMLLRHIFRNEKSWQEIAAKQPEAEQFACQMLFLGEAEGLFPEEYGNLVEKDRELVKLSARRDLFVDTLTEIATDLVSLKEAPVALTQSSIDQAIVRLGEQLELLTQRRNDVLRRLQSVMDIGVGDDPSASVSTLTSTTERLAVLQSEFEGRMQLVEATARRRGELEGHRRTVMEEIGKMSRARAAERELGALQITHCPQCDQEVHRDARPGHCPLCSQQVSPEGELKAAQARVEFELRQLEEEKSELMQLIASIDREHSDHLHTIKSQADEISALRSVLKPAHSAVSWLVPPELSEIDHERGRCSEQLNQLNRIGELLRKRDQLSGEVDRLNHDIALLSAEVGAKRGAVRASRAEDMLEEGLNTYLNALNAGSQGPRWSGGRVSVSVGARAIRMKLNGKNWENEVGATFTCYFLAAYNFALLRLTTEAQALYPGFAMVDLPANMSDHRVLRDQESYLARPFIALMNSPKMRDTQLIMSGHAYDGIKGASVIKLTRIYETEAEV